jgi:hypothetical protein
MATKLRTVEDELEAMDSYEAWRPALVAFYLNDGPWFQTVENVRRGDPLTRTDRRIINALQAALRVAP